MSGSVHWVVEAEIKEGKLDAFKELMDEMVEATRAQEPEALTYEWYVGEDGQRCHLFERYKDSAAVMTHLGNFRRNFAERLMAVVTLTGVTVYGDPDESVRGALSDFDPHYFSMIGGFAR